MKLLFEHTDPTVVEEARMLLESNGIPVYISNEATARNTGYFAVVGKLGFWVALDHHWEDAAALLDNSAHEVSQPINVSDYYAELETLRKQNTEKFYKRLMSGVVFAIALGVGFYLYSKIAGT